jgi:hypothetical protein
MILDSIAYLIGQYWVFLLLALIVGILTGWFSASRPAN